MAQSSSFAEVFIPARAGSSRFPNKPKAMLRGHSVLGRVVRIAQAALPEARVTVLSEDKEVLQLAQSLGADTLRIDVPCINGTERMAHALAQRGTQAEVVLNLQGDAVLVPPSLVRQTALAAQQEKQCSCTTPIVPLREDAYTEYRARKAEGRASGTLAMQRLDGTALCFTKGIAPHWRTTPTDGIWAWRHVGLYAMRPADAARYLRLPPTPLELAESLEQLRWLEHGHAIRLVAGELHGRTLWSIDHPEDVLVADAIIAREGELVP